MNTDEIIKKYQRKIEGNISFEDEDLPDNTAFSREYEIFREEALGRGDTLYETLARTAGKILTVKPKEADEQELQRAINRTHLHIAPSDATSLAALTGISIIFLALLLLLVTFLLGDMRIFSALMIMILGALLIKPLGKYPQYMASRWRLRASNQMVPCILYIVMYMRHTSNLEHAIKFAAQHVGNPLALDLRKIFWDVEADTYPTIKESLDGYLESWKTYNLEFVEAFHLIEGSLSEGNEQRRLELLEKSLNVMLDGTYERMLHFAHDLKSPITILYMLGIILPILGLIIFPLVSALLGGVIKWYHLGMVYVVVLPLVIFILGYNMLSKRSTGYGETEIPFVVEEPTGLRIFAGILIGVFLLVGFLPVLLHFFAPGYDPMIFETSTLLAGKLLDYKCGETCTGPFGMMALILSLLIPLGLGLGLGMYYSIATKEAIALRNKIKDLEKEFIGSLFQLGNRVADGIPVEVAFARVSQDLHGTPSGEFFVGVSYNLRERGMSLKDALFHEDYGIVRYFPSPLVETSMRILVEAAHKGPDVVAKSMISISSYVSKIHAVDERLKDLLADITSSMKSQVTFLTPLIAGIVVGVASMMVAIINKLSEQFAQASAQNVDIGNLQGLVSILKIENAIPSFYFQLIVGLFVIEITFILTYLSTTIENGIDPLTEKYNLGKNLLFAMMLYVIISVIGIFVFSLLAGGIAGVTTA